MKVFAETIQHTKIQKHGDITVTNAPCYKLYMCIFLKDNKTHCSQLIDFIQEVWLITGSYTTLKLFGLGFFVCCCCCFSLFCCCFAHFYNIQMGGGGGGEFSIEYTLKLTSPKVNKKIKPSIECRRYNQRQQLRPEPHTTITWQTYICKYRGR